MNNKIIIHTNKSGVIIFTIITILLNLYLVIPNYNSFTPLLFLICLLAESIPCTIIYIFFAEHIELEKDVITQNQTNIFRPTTKSIKIADITNIELNTSLIKHSITPYASSFRVRHLAINTRNNCIVLVVSNYSYSDIKKILQYITGRNTDISIDNSIRNIYKLI